MYKSNIIIKREALQKFLKKDLDFEVEVTPYSKFIFKHNSFSFIVSKNLEENEKINFVSNSKG